MPQSYEELVEYILRVLKRDLKLSPSQAQRVKEIAVRMDEKYKCRPSSLLIAIIETEFPEKKKVICMTGNINRGTINHIKREILPRINSC